MGTSYPTFPAVSPLLNHIPNSDRSPKSASKVSRRCRPLIRPYPSISLTGRIDVVPRPMPLSLALETRSLKEKERIEEDPALSTRPVPSPLPKPTLLVPSAPSHPVSPSSTTPTTATAATESPGPAPAPAPSRAKAKSSTSNGRASGARSKDKNKELSNGNAPPPPTAPSEPEKKSRSRRSSRRSEPQGWVEPVVAEHQTTQSQSHAGNVQQPQWQEPPPTPPRNAHTNAQPWLAGPASGFFEEHVQVPEGPFGATGRTIYSQR